MKYVSPSQKKWKKMRPEKMLWSMWKLSREGPKETWDFEEKN